MSTTSIAAMLGPTWTEALVYNRLAVLREMEAAGAGHGFAPLPTGPVLAPPVAPDPAGVKRIGVGLYLLAASLVGLREVLAHQAGQAGGAAVDAGPEPEPVPPVVVVTVAPARPAVAPAAVLPPPVNPPFIRRQKDYSGAEDDIIRAAWRDHPGHACSAAFAKLEGRTSGSIRYRAFMLGLRQDGGSRQDGAQPAPRSRAAKGRGRARQPVHTAQRIKPLTPRVLRFAGWFHVADWPLDEIADLFDLDVEGLSLALGVKAGVAA